MTQKQYYILFIIGLLFIGFLFYIVNIKEPSATSTSKSHTANQKSTPPDNTDRYAPKSYKEVFKESNKPQKESERITQEQRVAEMKAKSKALIQEAEAKIKEKNLQLPDTIEDMSEEETERMKKRIERLHKKLDQ